MAEHKAKYPIKSEDITQKILDIEIREATRKTLIKSCLIKAFELATNNRLKKSKLSHLSTSPHKDWSNASQEQTLKKLNEFERRVFVLKLELATKEHAHEAKLDQLNNIIDKLQSRIDELEASKKKESQISSLKTMHSPRARFTPQAGPTRSSQAEKRMPAISHSPFAGDTSSKSLFVGSDLARIASKATLKLSKDREARPETNLFSPNNSSAESTPLKSVRKLDLNVSSTSILGSSEVEDTFQTANGTFGDGAEKKKKRRIKLLSSQASKVLVSDDLNPEEDVNSLDYYLDANFQDETHQATTAKRTLEDGQEPAPKKRHVFKI